MNDYLIADLASSDFRNHNPQNGKWLVEAANQLPSILKKCSEILPKRWHVTLALDCEDVPLYCLASNADDGEIIRLSVHSDSKNITEKLLFEIIDNVESLNK